MKNIIFIQVVKDIKQYINKEEGVLMIIVTLCQSY